MRRAENSQLVAPREGDPQLRSTRTCCACTAASLQLQELEELGLLPAQSPTSTLPKMVAAVLGTPSCRSSRPTGRGCCCLDRWNDSQLDWQVRAHASVSGVSRNRFNQRCGGGSGGGSSAAAVGAWCGRHRGSDPKPRAAAAGFVSLLNL